MTKRQQLIAPTPVRARRRGGGGRPSRRSGEKKFRIKRQDTAAPSSPRHFVLARCARSGKGVRGGGIDFQRRTIVRLLSISVVNTTQQPLLRFFCFLRRQRRSRGRVRRDRRAHLSLRYVHGSGRYLGFACRNGLRTQRGRGRGRRRGPRRSESPAAGECTTCSVSELKNGTSSSF